MHTVTTAAQIFSRTLAFIQSSRWAQRPADDALTEHLVSYRVLITGSSDVLATEAGQQATALLVNLVARFCPMVEVDVPGHLPLLIRPNPIMAGPCLKDALIALVNSIWGSAMPQSPLKSRQLDLVVSVGPSSSLPLRTTHLQLAFGNWWGAVIEGVDSGPACGLRGQSPGPLVAACLGASSIFKAALRWFADRFPDLVNENTKWDLQGGSQCLSLLDYSLASTDLAYQEARSFPMPCIFISAGAICSATAYALHTLDLVLPFATVFEPKILDAPDLNRYITTTSLHIDQPKTHVLACWLPSIGAVECRNERFTGDVVRMTSGDDAVFVVGVDDVPSRWAAQKLWPRLLLVGGTEHDQLRVSAHKSPRGDGACAQCLDTFVPPTSPNDIIPAIGFVSTLTGLIIAAEMLKMTEPCIAPYRLCNVAGGRILQLAQRWNWHAGFFERNPDCELCRLAS